MPFVLQGFARLFCKALELALELLYCTDSTLLCIILASTAQERGVFLSSDLEMARP